MKGKVIMSDSIQQEHVALIDFRRQIINASNRPRHIQVGRYHRCADWQTQHMFRLLCAFSSHVENSGCPSQLLMKSYCLNNYRYMMDL